MEGVSLGNSETSPCSHCNNLQRTDPRGRSWRLETRLTSLESSANSGCRFCKLLVSGIDVCVPAWEPQKRAKSDVYEYEAELPFQGLTLNLDWHGANNARTQASVDFFTLHRGDASLIMYYFGTGLISFQRIRALGLASM